MIVIFAVKNLWPLVGCQVGWDFEVKVEVDVKVEVEAEVDIEVEVEVKVEAGCQVSWGCEDQNVEASSFTQLFTRKTPNKVQQVQQKKYRKKNQKYYFFPKNQITI